MSINTVPWLMAVLAAAWFGFLAFSTGRNPVSFALTGGLFALVIATFVFGLGEATSTPFSDRERASDHLLWTFIAAAIVALVAGLFTVFLRRSRQTTTAPVTQPQPTPSQTAPQEPPGRKA